MVIPATIAAELTKLDKLFGISLAEHFTDDDTRRLRRDIQAYLTHHPEQMRDGIYWGYTQARMRVLARKARKASGGCLRRERRAA
jgi:hypothetical protein